MNKAIVNILRFIILIAVQVFICNNIDFFGFLNPYIYILALLLLPLEIPKSAQYLIAFATGFIIDMFSLTFGMHASASLLVMLARPYIVNLLNGRHTTEGIEKPIPGVKDFNWLLAYTLILVFIHHFTFTLLEVFNFHEFFRTLGISLLNAIFTTLIILCIEYIFIPVKKR